MVRARVSSARSGRPVYNTLRLKDIAKVEEGLADARAVARSSGKPAVGLGIVKQRNANAVDVANRVKAKVAELNKTLPKGLLLMPNFAIGRLILYQ